MDILRTEEILNQVMLSISKVSTKITFCFKSVHYDKNDGLTFKKSEAKTIGKVK